MEKQGRKGSSGTSEARTLKLRFRPELLSSTFHNIYVYTYAHVYVTTVNEKRDHTFQRASRSILEGFEGGKEVINNVIIL